MSGWSKSNHICTASSFTSDLSRPVVFDMVSPKITLKGPYSIEGKVLILPIVGKGKAEIILGLYKFIICKIFYTQYAIYRKL